MAKPRLLLLDEPSLGLAPLIVQQVFRIIADIRTRGTTVLLVEQNAHMAPLRRRSRATCWRPGASWSPASRPSCGMIRRCGRPISEGSRPPRDRAPDDAGRHHRRRAGGPAAGASAAPRWHRIRRHRGTVARSRRAPHPCRADRARLSRPPARGRPRRPHGPRGAGARGHRPALRRGQPPHSAHRTHRQARHRLWPARAGEGHDRRPPGRRRQHPVRGRGARRP